MRFLRGISWLYSSVGTCPPVLAAPSLTNGSFETPGLGSPPSNYEYRLAGATWSFVANAGIAGNGSGFTQANPDAPDGVQVGFLQGEGAMSQSLTFSRGGTYSLTFMAAQRSGQTQDFAVQVDGVGVDTITPNNSSYAQHSVLFTVSAGSHTIGFVGLNSAGGDNTAFIDQVSISNVA